MDNNFSSFPEPAAPPPVEQKQSKLGIAAFVLGILALLIFCVAFIISFSYGFSLAVDNPNSTPDMIDQSNPAIVIASVLFCCSPVFSLAGMGLGIAAVVQKTEKKTFGIIGLVINSLIVLSLCGLFIIGLLAQAG